MSTNSDGCIGKSVDATVDRQICDLSIRWTGNDESVMGTNIDNM
jgi:hypothetical protein